MSIATRIGTTIGSTAAYAVHASIRAAQSTGSFGSELATATTQGYEAKRAELAKLRATVAQTPVAVKVVRKAKVAA